MAWGKCDDGFYDHPKVRAMSTDVRNAACGLFWRAISLCNRTLSDGRVTEYDLPTIDATDDQVSELVRVKLWHKAGRGWRVHDFLEFNDSRDAILARRETKAEAGRQGGLASGRTRRSRPRSRNEAPASPLVEPNRSTPGLNTRPVPNPDPSASYEAADPLTPNDPMTTEDDHLDAWYRLTASWPSDKVVPWLNQLAEQHGSAELSKALAVEVKADPNRATLIGRTRNRLEQGAHHAAKDAERRKQERDEARLREIESMPEEQRRENLGRLAEMMAAAGLGRPRESGGNA